MSTFALLIVNLLRSYWKPIAIISVVLSLLTASYIKGRRDCARRQDNLVSREVERIYENTEKEKGKLDQTNRRIEDEREKSPDNDQRDTCILSNDPFAKRCF